ncbi:MAG: sigma-54 dependent transcriptional regulator [Candidatus Binatus sp.]|uniref:sigma-54 interaction domain-containing protein n=1 Tax=Candidatus Binatus sp. TaxID=2811406 RepID=UPI003BB21586
MAPQELNVQKDRTTAEAGEELLASSATNFDPVDVAGQLLSGQADNAVGKVKPFPESFAHKVAEQPPPAWQGMVGKSSALNTASALVQKAARSEASILLHGESGTGKELAAKAIHMSSRRADQPFVAVDCAALLENLLEAELFGYEKGAYTGAIAAKPGLMEMADGGTLFLDEVGELPLSFQVKLLRALQEKEHRRLGGTKVIKFDARIVAATNRDLHKSVKEGEFREDLLFRLNVIPIRIPPLRERQGDVQLLASWFLKIYCEPDSGATKTFDPEVLRAFESYSWPGNVRELQNVVRRMCVMVDGPTITMREVPSELLSTPDDASGVFAETAAGIESCELAFSAAKTQYLNLFEASYLKSTLDRHAGNVSRAAEAARVDRKTFYRLLRKHRMEPERFRQ